VRRIFWVAVGAAAGIVLVRKLTKAAEAYTPAGIARSASSIGDGLRELAATIRDGMAEREAELRAALSADATPAPSQAPESTIGDPSGRHVAR
jgi:hypothetical protein